MRGIFSPDTEMTELPSGIWSNFPQDAREVAYDSVAAPYDWLVGNALYNRIIWGGWPSAYARAAEKAAEASRSDSAPVLDCGCGTLKFTAEAYRGIDPDRLTLFDYSLGMMKRAQRRLPTGFFVQGDAQNMPFESGIFGHVMSWGLLHLFGSKSPLLSELHRVMASGGKLSLSVLVKGERRSGDWTLDKLQKSGEIVEPESRVSYETAIASHFEIEQAYTSGSMLFVKGYKR